MKNYISFCCIASGDTGDTYKNRERLDINEVPQYSYSLVGNCVSKFKRNRRRSAAIYVSPMSGIGHDFVHDGVSASRGKRVKTNGFELQIQRCTSSLVAYSIVFEF